MLKRVHDRCADESNGCRFTPSFLLGMPQCSTPEHWRLIYELRVQVPWSDGERQERHHRIRHLSYKNWLKRPRSEWPYWVRFNAAVIELTKVNPFSETSYV